MGVAGIVATDTDRGSYRSRGTAAIIAVALHAALLIFLITSLSRVEERQPPAIEPMLAQIIDQPVGQRQTLERPIINPRFVKPLTRPADVAANVRIEVPLEVPPAPEPSDISASLLPGHSEVNGSGSSQSGTAGAESGSGAKILHQVAPAYSAASVKAHEQGTVTLRVLVNAQGVPAQVQVAGSSGFPRLDKSATEAVEHYRFSPPSKPSQLQGSWTTVHVEFDLLRMPVPTSIVTYDSSIAEQITVAQQSSPQLDPAILKTDALIRKLAGNLFDTLSRGTSETARTKDTRAKPTPVEVLTNQGKLKWVRFIGLAKASFDCGTANHQGESRDAKCEIFEVRQASGSSYWLSLVSNNGATLENIAITSDVRLSGTGGVPTN